MSFINCKICGIEKEFNENNFYKARKTEDKQYLNKKCKECHKKQVVKSISYLNKYDTSKNTIYMKTYRTKKRLLDIQNGLKINKVGRPRKPVAILTA